MNHVHIVLLMMQEMHLCLVCHYNYLDLINKYELIVVLIRFCWR